MAGGRPSTYTKEIGDALCEYIATSDKSLKKICEEFGIEVRTVLNWLSSKDNEEFVQQYARAREAQADYLAEQILEIADDSSGDLERVDEWGNRIENKEFINRSKVRIDARKWIASKLKPKKYGDKIDVTSGELPLTMPVPVININGSGVKLPGSEDEIETD